MKKNINIYWLFGCIVFILMVLISSLQLIPTNVDKSNQILNKLFEKSLEHLNFIAEKPHNSESLQKGIVKDYIISTIKKYGLNPVIQAGYIISDFWYKKYNKTFICSEVENIYIEIPGKTENKILIVAHYDTVPFSYGAADNSAAVSSALTNFENIYQQIQNGEKPLNSIIFLFTDAEDLGLLGADYFVRNYHDIDKIKIVQNLDARGNQGKQILFQSNDKYGDLLYQYSKYDKNLLAFSYANEIFKRLPNGTDFSLFLDKDIEGLNFAFIQNSIVYHSFLDNIKNLSKSSLFETNCKIYNFIKAFSNYNFDERKISNQNKNFIYFTIFGKLVILSKISYLLILFVVLLVLLILSLFLIFKKFINIKSFFGSILHFIIYFFSFAIITLVLRFLLYLIFPVLNMFYLNPYNETIFFLLLSSSSFFILSLIIDRFSKFIDFYSFFLTSAIISYLISLVLLKFITGLSVIFLLQTICFLLMIVVSLIFELFFSEKREKIYYPIHFLISVIYLIVGIPFSYLSYVALGLRNISFSLIALFPIIVIFGGNYNRINNYDKKIVSSFLLLLVIVLFALTLVNLKFDETKPILSTIILEKNNDNSQISLLVPNSEMKYSNNLWHKSLASLGKINNENFYNRIYELKEVKFPTQNLFKIINFNETKRFKEYTIEIKSEFWSLTLPENSQIVVGNFKVMNIDEITVLDGHNSYGKSIIVKIRIAQNQIIKYSFGNYYFQELYDTGIPKRPKEILGVFDKILEIGTLK